MFCKVLSLQRIPKDMDSMEWTVIPKTLHRTDVHIQIPHQKKNKIKTTKYTLFNFIPKNLFEQFHRFANLYFLFIIILNFIPQINAFGKEISMIPLIFVLAVTAVKDLVEDRQRYLSDKTVNNRYSDVYDLEKDEFRQKKWRDMEVGDIVRLNNNDIIPCDMLLIKTSDENGLCHISSANLDGENNLKQKKVPKGFLEDQNKFDAKNIGYQVKCKEPDDQIHTFCGYLVHPDGEGISLDQNNLLLRGCVLKNTEYIYGLVIYAGHDTKAMKNDNGPRYKRTQLEKDINTDVIGCVVILFTLCLIGAICCGFWTKRNASFEEIYSTDGAEESPSYEGFLRFWTFIIILQVIIPLSLYVSVEIVKLGQVYYINRDKHMIYHETAQYPVCRATNINEDLGQINYIFSDKTGTLTENKMIFKRFAMLGDTLVHPEDPSDDVTAGQCQELQDSFCKNNGPKAAQIWDDFFTTLAICNTVVVAKQPSVSSETLKISILNSSVNSDVSSVNKPMNGHVIQEGIATDSNDDESDGSSRKYNRSLTVPVTKGGIIVDEKEYNKRRLNGSVGSEIQRRYTYSKPINDRLSKSVESISSWLDCGLVPQYEYESPDEGALVKAASAYGYTLANRTPEQIFFTRSTGDIRIFDILQVLQFDSVRKRMSVIVRDDEGKIIIYCKGADTEIISVLAEGQREIRERTEKQLEEFACEGLRTLCVAMRVLSEDEYNAWLTNHKAAELALEDRAGKIAESAKAIEAKLTLLGATGIEDKLQDGVPETIAGLKSAGINLWILTGDKQETAVNIGFSCKLLNAGMNIITINSKTKSACSELLDQIIQREIVDSDSTSYTVLPASSKKKNNVPMALIIDGYSLAFTLEKPLDQKFIEIAKHCESVICCRAAPIQKAAVVKLMRENLKVMTLAIGDGANDVSMLQEAEIGVGIAGQEGVQAVMASDFVLGRFRFLKRLLLLHGFWCYDRIARMILYFFYKNTMFIGLLFWYQIFNGFSGSNAIDDVSLILFNLLFTSVPPIICGIWDQCIPEQSVLSRPMLYRWGQQGKAYTRTLFWLHILDSIFQSLVLFFIPYLTFSDLPFGMYAVGVTFHQLAVITGNLHIGIQTPNWTVIHAVVIIGSVVLSYLFYFVYCAISPIVVVYWAIYEVMGMPEFWFLCILCPAVALLPRILWKVCETTFFPSVIQQVQRYIHNKATKDKEDNALKNLSESNSNHSNNQNNRLDGNSIETSTPT